MRKQPNPAPPKGVEKPAPPLTPPPLVPLGPAALHMNHIIAFELAQRQRSLSNLARCYVELRLRVASLRESVESLRVQHYYCEDSWYSCPKHPEGCANRESGTECNCNAEKHNSTVDRVLTALK